MSALPKDNDFRLKRKRSPSPSNSQRDRSPPAHRRRSNSASDGGDRMSVDKERPAQPQEATFDAVAEFKKLTAGTRSGGVYMPPARLRALQEEAAKDKTSPEYQRLSWDALRKSITGIVNRVNIVNIKQIVPELFNENLVRGKGLFARSIMKAQAASLPFTPVFACLVAIINTKLPTVGELVLVRLVSQFRRSFKRNDKPVCVATSTFIAHLVNQSVADSALALQIIILLLERPTDSSVEIAVGFMKEVGAYLSEFPKENNLLFDRFRAVLHEGAIDKRVQYMIEVLFQVRKDQYKDNPMIPEGLDLVEQEDQITHEINLDDKLEVQESLNVFKFDPDYLQHEQEYKEFKSEVLGDDESESDEDGSDSESDDGDAPVQEKEGIQDKTETNLVNLRRVIYLTLQNALGYEEAVHKLLKIKLQEGEEIELCNMVVECASQERTYSRYYGLIGERLCKLNRVWYDCFEQAFGNYYETIHRYETNRLRIIAKFFGHLLASDAISWSVLEAIKMNENDTTSASRIFVKIMMQEMNEAMGTKALAERLKDPDVRQHCKNMFPTDLPKNTRFSINFFTSINLGVLTLEMREHLTNAQKLLMEQRAQAPSSSSSDSDSDSDSSSDSDSDSDDSRSRSRSISPRRRSRSRESGRYARRRYDSRSRSPRRTPPSSSRKRYDDSPPPKSRRSRSPRRDERDRRRLSGSPDDRRRSPPRKSIRRDSRSRSPRRDDRDKGYGRRYHSRSRTPPGRRGNGREHSYSRR